MIWLNNCRPPLEIKKKPPITTVNVLASVLAIYLMFYDHLSFAKLGDDGVGLKEKSTPSDT